MGCNCLQWSNSEEREIVTPRIVQTASRNDISRPPATKSRVPQKYAARIDTKEKLVGLKLAATKAIDGEVVKAINPSLPAAPEPVHGSTNDAEIKPNPTNISSISSVPEVKNVSTIFANSAAGDRSVEPPIQLKLAEVEAASLWKAAYDKVKKANPSLIEDLETVIKAEVSISAETDLMDQIALVGKAQRGKMESKQWSFPWFGTTLEVRKVVDNIISMLDNSKGLISMGMSCTPIYVSIPWSAVAALLPLMMRDHQVHKEALQGLERVTQILWCYATSEKAFFDDPSTRDAYSIVLIPLYVELLKYNCIAAQYFGHRTLKRVWKNTAGTIPQADNSAQIVVLDDDCRRAIQFIGFGRLQRLLKNQDLALEEVIKSADGSRTKKHEILRRH